MQTYKIEIDKPAIKFLERLPAKEKKRILSKIFKLPNTSGVKKLTGYSNWYRLRIGDYRIIYEKLEDRLIIIILEVGNRGDIYK